MPEKVKRAIVLRAILEAKLACHKHQMGAVVFDKRYILSSGHNYPSKSAKHLHPRFSRWRGSIHAEVDAILKARKDIKGCSIIVIRVIKSGLGLAKPCMQCISFLNHVGIKSIFYSNDKGVIVKYA